MGAGCRSGGDSKFVCVDGPEFDAHTVDFDLMMKRQRTFLSEENAARLRFLEDHECQATKGAEVS